MNIVCSDCNFSNPYTYFSRSVGYYNVNVKLAGISAEKDSKLEDSGLASRSITDNAGWHTQNTQIFYPTLLTCKNFYGIFISKKRDYFKGKPVERQERKARRD